MHEIDKQAEYMIGGVRDLLFRAIIHHPTPRTPLEALIEAQRQTIRADAQLVRVEVLVLQRQHIRDARLGERFLRLPASRRRRRRRCRCAGTRWLRLNDRVPAFDAFEDVHACFW